MATGRKLAALCLTALLATPVAAQDGDFVQTLTDQNIRAFLERTQTLSTSGDHGASDEDLRIYFTRHIADKGEFRSRLHFEMPGFPTQDAETAYKKDDFIGNVIEGRDLMADYSATFEIKKMKIAGNGRSAKIESIITEKGKLPWPPSSTGQQGSQQILPVEGRSECEQTLIVSLTNYIQMASAACRTAISFAPFDKPLGE